MRLIRYCFLACAVLSCSQGTSGALGQTETSASCPPTQLVCSVGGIDAPIAKGATLPIEVSVTSEGSSTPPLDFASANEGIFKVSDGRLFGQGPGLAALLITTQENLVVDFLHVWVAEADSLRLHRLLPSGFESSPMPAAMQMLVGDELKLAAVAHRGAQRLLGELSATFDADPQVVKMLDEGVPSSRRFVAIAPGSTTLQVVALDMMVQVDLEVLP